MGALLSLTATAAVAQTTVFSSDLTSGVINPGTYSAPTASSMDWTVGSTKSHGVASIGSGMTVQLGSTSAAYVEVAGVFTSTPIALSSVGDFVSVELSFTTTLNILAGSNSVLGIGLYDSGGSNPPDGVSGNILLADASTDFLTGGMKDWTGYFGNIAQDSATSRLYSRVAQTTTPGSAVQELLFPGNGGALDEYVNVGSASSGTNLADGSTYTLLYTVSVNASSEIDILYSLFDGVGTGGTQLASVFSTATGSGITASQIDALGFGYVAKSTSGGSGLVVNSLDITMAGVPEPSSFALLGGFAALLLVARRRRA